MSLKIIVSALLVIIGLNPSTCQQFIKGFMYFYAINFLVAGATIGLTFLVNSQHNTSQVTYFWLTGGIACSMDRVRVRNPGTANNSSSAKLSA